MHLCITHVYILEDVIMGVWSTPKHSHMHTHTQSNKKNSCMCSCMCVCSFVCMMGDTMVVQSTTKHTHTHAHIRTHTTNMDQMCVFVDAYIACIDAGKDDEWTGYEYTHTYTHTSIHTHTHTHSIYTHMYTHRHKLKNINSTCCSSSSRSCLGVMCSTSSRKP